MLLPGRPDTRKHVAGAATAAGRNSCGEAVERAIADLGQRARARPVLSDGPRRCRTPQRTRPRRPPRGARVAGMTGTAAIGADGLIETGCSAIAFSSSLPAGWGRSEAATRARPARRGREALAGIDDAPYRVVLLFVDSESGDQAEIVAGAYAVAGGPIPLAGGAAGGARARPFRGWPRILRRGRRRRDRERGADRRRHRARVRPARRAVDRDPLGRPERHPARRPARAGRLLRDSSASTARSRRRRRVRAARHDPSARRAGAERCRPAALCTRPRSRRRARLRHEYRAQRGRRDLRPDAGDGRSRARV